MEKPVLTKCFGVYLLVTPAVSLNYTFRLIFVSFNGIHWSEISISLENAQIFVLCSIVKKLACLQGNRSETTGMQHHVSLMKTDPSILM